MAIVFARPIEKLIDLARRVYAEPSVVPRSIRQCEAAAEAAIFFVLLATWSITWHGSRRAFALWSTDSSDALSADPRDELHADVGREVEH